MKRTSTKHIIDPPALNRWLDDQLAVRRDWDWHPLIIEADPADKSRNSQVRSDFRKSRIEVEVQFGNVARYAYDVYKMAISLALGNVAAIPAQSPHSPNGSQVSATASSCCLLDGCSVACYLGLTPSRDHSRRGN